MSATAPAFPNRINDEVFDVVNLNDQVLRQERRSVVHRYKLYHRAVHVFVFNESGELYLQRRSMNKDSAPGKWVSSCSGHVDAGEDYDRAAARELAEEIGLHYPADLKRIFKEVPCRATGYEFTWVYTGHSDGPFDLDPDEVMDGKWITLPELEKWIKRRPRDFAWSFAHLWERYREIVDARKPTL